MHSKESGWRGGGLGGGSSTLLLTQSLTGSAQKYVSPPPE